MGRLPREREVVSGLVEVQIREDCPDCENGVVQTVAWGLFHTSEGDAVRTQAEQLRAAGEYGKAIELELAWFRERGFSVPPHDRYGQAFPPEEEPCAECDGTGKRVRWVSTRELTNHLAIQDMRA